MGGTITSYDHMYWFDNNILIHRDDGPAVEGLDGITTRYHIHGKHIHQLDNKHIYGKKKLAKYLLLV
jgi:hypothetical protein